MDRLHAHLTRYCSADWRRTVDTLIGGMHEIDHNATRIWFAFYPLDLCLYLEAAASEPGGLEAAIRKAGLMGNWRLADHVDTSHRFFFSHRYWPQVKSAVQNAAAPYADDLGALATSVAEAAARTARVDREFLIGISLAALMTLRQAGPAAFAAAPGEVHLSDKVRARSPHQVLKARARDDSQGLMGFTRGLKKLWTVTFDENEPAATFTLVNGQEIATAAQTDKRDHKSRDARCTPGEGPIPVECRAASCGTCWIGVIGGADKLSPVVDRDERERMRVFGYINSNEPQPLIRLACQARASGAVSVVIPPWNGIFGKVITKA